MSPAQKQKIGDIVGLISLVALILMGGYKVVKWATSEKEASPPKETASYSSTNSATSSYQDAEYKRKRDNALTVCSGLSANVSDSVKCMRDAGY